MPDLINLASRLNLVAENPRTAENGGDPLLVDIYLRVGQAASVIAGQVAAAPPSHESAVIIERALETIESRLDSYPRVTDEVRGEGLTAVHDALINLKAGLEHATRLEEPNRQRYGSSLSRVSAVTDQVGLVRAVWQRISAVVGQVTSATTTMNELLQAANSAKELAQKAASKSGTSALEDAFNKVAEDETKFASRWRVATIWVLGAVVGLGVFYVIETTGTPPTWQGLAYRLTIASAMAAIAAYLARQSSHHRRIATWARAIEVQLKSFRSFVEPIKDQRVQDGMYEIFGRRVLGAPPEGKGGEELGNLVQPLLEQVIRRA